MLTTRETWILENQRLDMSSFTKVEQCRGLVGDSGAPPCPPQNQNLWPPAKQLRRLSGSSAYSRRSKIVKPRPFKFDVTTRAQ
jgi:hypothetical protein